VSHLHAAPGQPEPLGVRLDGDHLNVAVHAEGATAVEFCVFDDTGETRVFLPGRTASVFHGRIRGLGVGTRYGLRVHGPWEPRQGLRFNPAKLLLDPYARAIEGSFVDHPSAYGHIPGNDGHADVRNDDDSAPWVPRCVVIDESFDWQGDSRPHIDLVDSVIYEVHVRGFTKTHPGIPEHLRGTYAGMAHPVTIDYLQSLGITTIELLPVHHFVDETHLQDKGLTNYWGYNTVGFFAPHAAYATHGGRGEQVHEFKEMVRALHAAGIAVLLDVVYNHTAEANELGPTLMFRGLSNHTYYHLEAGGISNDNTGCGNTVNANHPAALRLIMDSLRYWVQEMHVDGFRFDLATSLVRNANGVDMHSAFISAIGQDPILRDVILIAEPWDVGPDGYRVGAWPAPWAEWNDRYRDSVRDFWRGSSHGVQDLGWRLTGSADIFGPSDRTPSASINFITAHDGFCLNDLVSYDHKRNEANMEDGRDGSNDNRSSNHGVEGPTRDTDVLRLRRRQMRNMLATLLLSAGTPMLVAGDEFGRTQQGNNNPYCQDNEISWLSWDHEPWQRLLRDFSARLIRLRRDHQALRRRTFFSGEPVAEGGPQDLAWLDHDGQPFTDGHWQAPDRKSFGMYLDGRCGTDAMSGEPIDDSSVLILINGHNEFQRFVLPGSPYGRRYQRLIDTVEEAQNPVPWIDTEGEHVVLAPRSLILFSVTER
jgi:isoamylase